MEVGTYLVKKEGRRMNQTVFFPERLRAIPTRIYNITKKITRLAIIDSKEK